MSKIETLGKWVITKKDGDTFYARHNKRGIKIIEVQEGFDEYCGDNGHIYYCIRYWGKNGGDKWGDFVADAVPCKDLANAIVKFWLDKKGYE